jgi:hypothetical protein
LSDMKSAGEAIFRTKRLPVAVTDRKFVRGPAKLTKQKAFVPCAQPTPGRAVHPFIWWIFKQINEQRASVRHLFEKAGIAEAVARRWRTGKSDPTLSRVEAVINALGGTIHIRMHDARGHDDPNACPVCGHHFKRDGL